MPHTSTRASLLALAALLLACPGSSGPDPVRALQIAPAAVSLPRGLSHRLAVTATLASGGTAPADATWSSDEPTIATVDAEGVVTGRGQGATTIRASVGTISAEVPVTVLPPVPVSIRIEPAGASLPLGLSQAFRAVGLWLSDGSVGSLSGPVTWSSSDGAVLAVAGDGVARPVSIGVADVVASAGSLSGRASVVALPAAPEALELGMSSLALGRVERRGLAVLVRYTDGSIRGPHPPVLLAPVDSTVVGVDAGELVARKPGASSVVVSAEGISVSLPVSVASHALVFRTSTTGPGKLGAWPGAAGRVGPVAGDAICQAHAVAGGLGGTFRAFLSTSTTDAVCRALGFEGRLATGCGQPSAPGSGGAWIRRDGFQFGDDLVSIVEEGPRVPPIIDELGMARPGALWTGGASLSNPSPQDCSGWTSAFFSGRLGFAEHAGSVWSWAGVDSCSGAAGLLCVEVLEQPADPLPAIPPVPGRRAFATTAVGTGDLSTWADASGFTGRAAGNAVCQAEAERAGLPRALAYQAWLSEATGDARDGLRDGMPWYRVDGVPLAGSLADLLDLDPLFTSLSLTAAGTRTHYSRAWTGTGRDGRGTANRCGDWGSTLEQGTVGQNGSSLSWTDDAVVACSSVATLLCFEY